MEEDGSVEQAGKSSGDIFAAENVLGEIVDLERDVERVNQDEKVYSN